MGAPVKAWPAGLGQQGLGGVRRPGSSFVSSLPAGAGVDGELYSQGRSSGGHSQSAGPPAARWSFPTARGSSPVSQASDWHGVRCPSWNLGRWLYTQEAMNEPCGQVSLVTVSSVHSALVSQQRAVALQPWDREAELGWAAWWPAGRSGGRALRVCFQTSFLAPSVRGSAWE